MHDHDCRLQAPLGVKASSGAFHCSVASASSCTANIWELSNLMQRSMFSLRPANATQLQVALHRQPHQHRRPLPQGAMRKPLAASKVLCQTRWRHGFMLALATLWMLIKRNNTLCYTFTVWLECAVVLKEENRCRCVHCSTNLATSMMSWQ